MNGSPITFLTRTDPHRLIPRIVVGMFLLGMILSWRLWVPIDREFPLVSLLESFPVLYGVSGDLLLLTLLLAGMGLLWVAPSSRFSLLLITFALLGFILEDVNRLQPWVWFSLLILWLLPRPPGRRSFQDGTSQKGSELLRRRAMFPDRGATERLELTVLIVLAGLYLWSGLWKLNPLFAAEVVPTFLSGVGLEGVAESLPVISWLVPVVEVLGGLSLLTRFGRKVMVRVLIGLHLCVIIALLFLSWNSVVIPWNLALIALLLALPESAQIRTALLFKGKGLAALLLALVLPLFHLNGWLDSTFAAELYSGNGTVAVFSFHEDDRERMPEISDRFHFYTPGTDVESIVLNGWCNEELNVPFYAERRYAMRVGEALCARMTRPAEARLRISEMTPFTSKEEVLEFRCGEF